MVAAILLGLLYLSVTVSAATVVGARVPGLALRIAPFSGQALANAAAKELEPVGGAPVATGRAIDFARRSMAVSAINSRALSVIGLASAAGGDDARADRAIAFAEQLDRRNVLAQLYQIERAVGRGDVPGALGHYRIALTTNPDTETLLFPVLVAASGDPALRGDFAAFLCRTSAWRNELAFRMAGESSAPTAVAELILAASRCGLPVSTDVANVMTERLVNSGDVRAARGFVSRLPGPRDGVVRNARFARPPVGLPLDWSYASTEAASADAETAGGAGGLILSLQNGSPATVARQMVVLTPGRHLVFASYRRIAGTGAAPIAVGLACVDGRPLARATSIAPSGRIAQAFVAPNDCPAAWLSIEADERFDIETIDVAIDAVDIR